MTDLLKAAQDAFFAALNVPAVTSIGPVYQHLPDELQPPFVQIADITAESIGPKGGTMERLTVDVFTYRREPAREALYDLMAAVRGVLHDQSLTAAGAILSPPEQVTTDDTLLDDGQTYWGLQRFTLIAQPA
jgi:hypothetical protein